MIGERQSIGVCACRYIKSSDWVSGKLIRSFIRWTLKKLFSSSMTECLSLVHGTSTKTLSNALNSSQSKASDMWIWRCSFHDSVRPMNWWRTLFSRLIRLNDTSLHTNLSEISIQNLNFQGYIHLHAFQKITRIDCLNHG